MTTDHSTSGRNAKDSLSARFLAPLGTDVTLDESGFLVDPKTLWGQKNQTLIDADGVDHYSFVGLLGVPGIGKSTLLRDLYERSTSQTSAESTLWFDLSVFSTDTHLVNRIFEDEVFLAHRRDNRKLVLYLDSLDEGALNVKSIAKLLAWQLESQHWAGLSIRISCRTAVWPTVLDRVAATLWPKSHLIAELQPLRRSDVKTAAVRASVDDSEFLEAIDRSHVGAFAARPVTLKFLLNLYARSRDLPRSRRELYLSGLQALVDELNESRRAAGHRGQLAVPERLALAEAIATISVFCNQGVVWIGPHSTCPSGCLSIDRLADAARTLRLEFDVSLTDAVTELLDTGLFVGRGTSRVGWAHESYREYLAARFLTDRCRSRWQMESLITNSCDPDRKIPPQLYGTAGWLYEFSPTVRDYINEREPELVLQSDMDIESGIPREPLVDAVLRLADAGRLFDPERTSRHRYQKLAHDRLALQLSPFMRDKQKNVVVRRMTIDIAQACNERRALPDLTAIALDRSDDTAIRERAAFAVAQMGADGDREALRAFVQDPIGTGATDDLVGIALDALWPNHLSSEELFARIQTPAQEHHFGSYQLFVHSRLPREIDRVDLLPAIQWLSATASERPDITLEPLQRAVLRHALEHCESEEVRRELGEAIWRHISKFSQIFERHSEDEAPWIVRPASARQPLLIQVARQIMKPEVGAGFVAVSRLPVLNPLEDFEFLLAEFTASQTQPLRQTIGELLSRSMQMHTTPDRLEIILGRCGMSAANRDVELAHHFRWLVEPMILGSQEAQSARAVLQAHKEFLNRPQSTLLDPPPEERIRLVLEKIEEGLADWWHSLIAQLSLESNSIVYGHVGTRVLEQPGWIRADAETRNRIARAAQAFLKQYNPRPDLTTMTNQWQSFDESPLVALLVLYAQAPDLYRSIDNATWARLLPCLLSVPWDDSDVLRSALHHAYGVDTVQADALAIARLRLAVGSPFLQGALDKLELVWSPSLDTAAQRVLQDLQISNEGFRDLLRRVVMREPTSGVPFALQLLAQPPRPELGPATLAVLTCYALAGSWQSIWPVFASNHALAKVAMLDPSISEEAFYQQVQRLSPNKLGLVYGRLQELFPASADPPVTGYVLPRHTAARLRDTVLAALSRLGTFEACQVIERLTESNASSLQLKYTLVEARKLARAVTWEAPSVEALTLMLEDRGKRLVRDADELLDVILETLSALQVRLQGPNKPVSQFWDERAGDQRPKSETRLADNVRDYLDLVLRQQGTIVNREVEVRNLPGSGIGERTDLLVSAASRSDQGSKGGVAEVVIECKGCWNSGLFTDMETQLRERYLIGSGYKAGIYLVGWFLCAAWSSQDARLAAATRLADGMSIDELRTRLALQAQALSTEIRISPCVLDLSLN